MRHSYDKKKLARRKRKPSELLLVPMIDIFTVLVTFLLMTAVFSRTVILELNLPRQQASLPDLPRGLQLEVLVRRNLIDVVDRSGVRLKTLPNVSSGHDYAGLSEYLKFVKSRYPEKTDATLLLEADVPYDTLVQVMDAVRVFEARDELGRSVQAELFPDISIGDAPT